MKDTFKDGVRTAYGFFSPFYSRKHKKWYGLGRTTDYRDDNSPILLKNVALCTSGSPDKSIAVTVRYAFEEDGLRIVRAGTPLHGSSYGRGLDEPSLAYLGGKYYMTIRTDEVGLFAESADGFTFTEPEPWRWDDGTVLENYNIIEASASESWLITAEWMQPAGCEKYGSDNSLWLAKVFFEEKM